MTTGLDGSERIVLEGVDDLTEGAKVESSPAQWTAHAARASTGAGRGRGAAAAEDGSHEHLTPVHRAAGRHGAAHGGRAAVGAAGLPAAARVGAAAGRLPDDPLLTFFPGASPEVMTSAVTAPLERQFGQMPGLDQMSSTSSGGASVITLRFALEKPIEVAEQEVQAAINAANTLLPNDLPQPPVYNKVNPADTPVLTLAITSKTMPLPQVHDLVDTRSRRSSRSSPGVGLVSIAGGQRPAVRIQANPQALAAHNLNLQSLRAGDRRRERQPAEGQLRRPRAIVHARRERPAALARRLHGPDRRVSRRRAAPPGRRGRASWTAPRTAASPRGRTSLPAVLVNVQRQPGANVIEVVDASRSCCRSSPPACPRRSQVSVISDRTGTIRASVRDVQHELVFAVGLVVLVTFLFLRNVSATIIPSVVVPLSLIGTFGVMYLAGFSVNILTLMALTIATGFVVDDAIVMVENIARHIEEGEPPFEAALKGAQEIGFTLVSLTMSLIAVLIPLLFMADVVGRLFREFAITLAVSILISLVVSLTLTPMMSARMLRHMHTGEQGWFYRKSGACSTG